jgi:hypothetical protein
MLNVKFPPEVLAYCKKFMSESRLHNSSKSLTMKNFLKIVSVYVGVCLFYKFS